MCKFTAIIRARSRFARARLIKTKKTIVLASATVIPHGRIEIQERTSGREVRRETNEREREEEKKKGEEFHFTPPPLESTKD